MRKRRKSDDVIMRRRQKRSLKEARRTDQRRQNIQARNARINEARLAAFEELKKQLVEDWEKKFDGR